MKRFIKWKILIVTCAVCLVPVALGLVLWDKLPENIAIHFNMNNIADNYSSKAFAVFGLPAMMIVLQIICCVINDVNAKKHGERKKLELATKWIIPIMAILLQGAIFAYALGKNVDIRRYAMVIVGAIFILIGNYMPKLDYIKDYDVDTEKARKINRFIGFEMVLMGVLAFITLFFPPIASVIWLFALVPYTVIAIIYSIRTVKK